MSAESTRGQDTLVMGVTLAVLVGVIILGANVSGILPLSSKNMLWGGLIAWFGTMLVYIMMHPGSE